MVITAPVSVPDNNPATHPSGPVRLGCGRMKASILNRPDRKGHDRDAGAERWSGPAHDNEL